MSKAEQIALAFLGVTAVGFLIFGVSKAMAQPTLAPKGGQMGPGPGLYLHPDGQYYPTPPTGTSGDWTGGPDSGGGFNIGDVLGDPCKRWCDVKHFFNREKRVACKDACESDITSGDVGGFGHEATH